MAGHTMAGREDSPLVLDLGTRMKARWLCINVQKNMCKSNTNQWPMTRNPLGILTTTLHHFEDK